MKRSKGVLLAAGVLFVLSIMNLLRSRGHEVSASGPKASSVSSTLIAAPGRVEAVSEEIRVSSELSGRLKTVRVEEGDRVQLGQVLAEIENDDYRAHAEATVATALAQLAEARAFLEKSYIRAPINGVILRKLRHNGESVSTQFDSPIITMADDSVLRVRLDVDESDVSKLRVGQRAYVTAEAYGTHKFWGRVIRVGHILGKKNVRAYEPSEHVDTKILETLVELDAGQQLQLGLRVHSYVPNVEGAGC